MAFAEYAFLIKPGLKAFSVFVTEIKKAKGDDGKVSADEFSSALGTMFESLWKVSEPLIREDEDGS